MSILTHDPAPLHRNADNCEHIAPAEPDTDNDGSQAWLAYDSYLNDHPNCPDIGEPVCEGNVTGYYCPACTEYARAEFELARDAYIDIADCVHAPAVTE